MERSCGEDRLATRRRTGRLSKRQARRALPAGRKIRVARFHGKSKRINHWGHRGTQGKEHRGNLDADCWGLNRRRQGWSTLALKLAQRPLSAAGTRPQSWFPPQLAGRWLGRAQISRTAPPLSPTAPADRVRTQAASFSRCHPAESPHPTPPGLRSLPCAQPPDRPARPWLQSASPWFPQRRFRESLATPAPQPPRAFPVRSRISATATIPGRRAPACRRTARRIRAARREFCELVWQSAARRARAPPSPSLQLQLALLFFDP